MTATHCCSALELRWKLRQLRHHYDVTPQLNVLPLSDPASGAMILTGIAANTDCDLDRLKLAPHALNPLPRRVPVLMHHDPTLRVGELQQLDYDGYVLRARVRVEHEQARRLGAFSVGLRIIECALVDAETDRFYGLLRRAELSEISITDRPGNPAALVESRVPACFSDYWSNASTAVSLIVKSLKALEVIQHNAARQRG